MSNVRIELSGAVMTHPRRERQARDLIAGAPPGQLCLAVDPEPSGPPTALRSAMLAWSLVGEGATHHLVLQDDALLSDGFFDRIREAVAAAPQAAIAAYAHWNSRNGAAIRVGALAGRRWADAVSEYVPTVALVLPAEAAAGFADYARRHGAGWPDDVVMQRYLAAVGLPVRLTVPSLVDHDDLPSVMRNDYHGLRRAACFADLPGGADWSLPAAEPGPDVVPFFKYGTAQCAVRVGAGSGWTTLDAERFGLRIGFDAEAFVGRLDRVIGSSARFRELADRVSPKALRALWLTAGLLGRVVPEHSAPDGGPRGAAPWEQLGRQALATLGPGGLCTDLPATVLLDLQSDLADLTEQGVALGRSQREARRPGRPTGPGRPTVALTGADGPLARYLARDLADRGYLVWRLTTAADDFDPRLPDTAMRGVDAVLHVGSDQPPPALGAAGHLVRVEPYRPGPEPTGRADGAGRAEAGAGSGTGPVVTVLRLGEIYGPGISGATPIEDFLERAMLTKPLTIDGSVDRPTQYVHVQDVGRAVDRALRTRQPGEFDIANERVVTALELADTVSRTIRPVRIRLASRTRPSALPRAMATDRARKQLGWQPAVDFDEGLRGCAQWIAYEAPARAVT